MKAYFSRQKLTKECMGFLHLFFHFVSIRRWCNPPLNYNKSIFWQRFICPQLHLDSHICAFAWILLYCVLSLLNNRHVWLTHWGRVTHIFVSKMTIIGSDNGLSPGRRQAITWTSVGILLVGPLGTNFSKNLIEIYSFSFKKIHFKMSGKLRPFCLGLNVLNGTMNHNEIALPWRHNGRDSVSNHQPRDCLLNRLFRYRSKETSKLRVTGLCEGNSLVIGEFPAQMASNAENVSI